MMTKNHLVIFLPNWVLASPNTPKYTIEELKEAKKDLNETFFIDIVRHAKKYKQAMVYMEYETDFEINEDYRHYAIANESQSLARLPYIIALPEDKERFSLESLKDDVYWEIFDQIYNVWPTYHGQT